MDQVPDFIADSRLVLDLPRPLPPKPDDPWEHVLLTGGTGFLGVHLLDGLLRQSHRTTVWCLVRCPDEAEGLRRIDAIAAKHRVDTVCKATRSDRIRVLPGSFGPDWFSPAANPHYTRLAATIGVVFHAAGDINFGASYSEFRRVWFEGLKSLVRFCATTRTKRLHWVGSLAAQHFDDPAYWATETYWINGYGRLKYASREFLLGTMRATGLPGAVYEPPFIVGSFAVGTDLGLSYVMWYLCRLLLVAGVMSSTVPHFAVVPVDVLVDAMLYNAALDAPIHSSEGPHDPQPPSAAGALASAVTTDGSSSHGLQPLRLSRPITGVADVSYLKALFTRIDPTFRMVTRRECVDALSSLKPRRVLERLLPPVGDDGVPVPFDNRGMQAAFPPGFVIRGSGRDFNELFMRGLQHALSQDDWAVIQARSSSAPPRAKL